MVAETLTATRAKSGFPVAGTGAAGDIKVAWGTYDLAANVEDGDIFEMCKVPANATIISGHIVGEDIDTGTETLDIDAGWASNGTDAADPDGLGNFGVVTGDASATKPEVGVFLHLGGVLRTGGPKTLLAETTLQIEANAAAATGGTGRLTMVVFYTVL